tara:strand:- start:1233 stop:1547 length:315 start_codon:yes stop_codon:yes gene_type:complete
MNKQKLLRHNNKKILATEIAYEVENLSKAKKELIIIIKQLIEAGFTELQANKRIAKAVNIDFRTLLKWLSNDTCVSHMRLVGIVIFIESYKNSRLIAAKELGIV